MIGWCPGVTRVVSCWVVLTSRSMVMRGVRHRHTNTIGTRNPLTALSPGWRPGTTRDGHHEVVPMGHSRSLCRTRGVLGSRSPHAQSGGAGLILIRRYRPTTSTYLQRGLMAQRIYLEVRCVSHEMQLPQRAAHPFHTGPDMCLGLLTCVLQPPAPHPISILTKQFPEVSQVEKRAKACKNLKLGNLETYVCFS